MAGQKLPVGIQSFEKIIEEKYAYVDKTEYIWNLVNSGSVFFLSRPRRFGKSLLISTMEAYFQGKKELFKGLAMEELEAGRGEDAWQSYPVLRFSLSGGDYNEEGGLEKTLDLILSLYEATYGVDPGDYDLPNRFRLLIERIYRESGVQVVVLVDEYDKPLLETMVRNKELEEKNRRLYKGFYSVLKDEDQYLKFVFFTGVTKFGKVSIFSDLNQLNDISLDNAFSGICGITEKELLSNFQPEIAKMAGSLKVEEKECIRRLAEMYDGYCFSAEGTNVYNPFSLLKAFWSGRMGRYWYETGTPTFLLEKLKQSGFAPERFTEGIVVEETSLTDYQADDPDPIPLFYQTGYLTICGFDQEFGLYTLRFPNNEVQYGFLNSLSRSVLGAQDWERPLTARNLVLDLRRGDVQSAMERLVSIFAAIPYPEGKKSSYEQEWRNEVFLIFMLMGEHIDCEVHSATGRADCVLKTRDYIYIIEFKLDKSADEALQQIADRGYALPYKADPRQKIRIGVNFSSEKRNIEEWKMG